MSNSKELIFVYNADSGKWNSILDAICKVISPETYSCDLCAITYGNFAMKKEWKLFIEKLPVPVRFLHRDEWEKEFQRKDKLPAVFLRENGRILVWIEAETMGRLDLKGLKDHLDRRLLELGGPDAEEREAGSQ